MSPRPKLHIVPPPPPPPDSARVRGEVLTEWPPDLYIPPEALEVFLESFEGPLDLLLYLIRKQNLDILDIPVAEITRQYVQYVELMRTLRLDLAAEYLVMAAMLTEIKSRMLLPKPETGEEEEDDPRAALVRRLQQYERFRDAAGKLNEKPRLERDIFIAYAADAGTAAAQPPPPRVYLDSLVDAYHNAMEQARRNRDLVLGREVLSVRERMTLILAQLSEARFLRFEQVFTAAEGRMGLVVSLSALLELLRENMITVVQNEPFSPIHLRAV
ncbi:MAG: segregation/condensation protein A [Gammaproteobacteria bacterium]|nr:segregation/condensation protein A [Gammaproteobacteria bacterium]